MDSPIRCAKSPSAFYASLAVASGLLSASPVATQKSASGSLYLGVAPCNILLRGIIFRGLTTQTPAVRSSSTGYGFSSHTWRAFIAPCGAMARHYCRRSHTLAPCALNLAVVGQVVSAALRLDCLLCAFTVGLRGGSGRSFLPPFPPTCFGCPLKTAFFFRSLRGFARSFLSVDPRFLVWALAIAPNLKKRGFFYCFQWIRGFANKFFLYNCC